MCQQPDSAWGTWAHKKSLRSQFSGLPVCLYIFFLLLLCTKWFCTSWLGKWRLREMMGAERHLWLVLLLSFSNSIVKSLHLISILISCLSSPRNVATASVYARADCVSGCSESQWAPPHLCWRATKSIGSYQEGRGWRRAVPSQEGASRPLREALKVHVYSRSVRGMHSGRRARTHTTAGVAFNDPELGAGIPERVLWDSVYIEVWSHQVCLAH